MSNSTFRQKDIQHEEPNYASVTTLYAIIGQHDEVTMGGEPLSLEGETSKKVCAKKVELNDKVKFYIKTDNRGRFANPVDMYAERLTAKEKEGRSIWQFREVTPKVFNNYMQFLKTRNQAWLFQAERVNN